MTSWCPLSLPPLTNFDLLSSLYVRDVLTNKAKVRTVRYRSGSGTDVGLPVTFLPLSLSLSAIITFLLFVLQDRLRSDNMQQTADKAVLTIVDTCNIYRTGHNDKKTKLLRLLSFTKI